MKTRLVTILAMTATVTTLLVRNIAHSADTPETITKIDDAWAKLYDDEAFGDNVLTVKGKADITDLGKNKWDSGQDGPNDRITSVRFQIPKGWKLVLFDDKNFKDSSYELKGTGKVVEVAKLGSFGDRCTSMRWEQEPQ